MTILYYYTLGPGGMSEMAYYGNKFARERKEKRYAKLFLWLLLFDILIVCGITK